MSHFFEQNFGSYKTKKLRKRRIFDTPEEENRNMISLQISNICSKEILIKEKFVACIYQAVMLNKHEKKSNKSKLNSP